MGKFTPFEPNEVINKTTAFSGRDGVTIRPNGNSRIRLDLRSVASENKSVKAYLDQSQAGPLALVPPCNANSPSEHSTHQRRTQGSFIIVASAIEISL
jgi:hypothetical protein